MARRPGSASPPSVWRRPVLVLLVATLQSQAAWLLVLLGVALAATTVRAASKPSVIRLTSLGAVMVSVLYVGQTF